MDPAKRILLRVRMPHRYAEDDAPRRARPRTWSRRLMGRKPELRFHFIQENAKFAQDLDV